MLVRTPPRTCCFLQYTAEKRKVIYILNFLNCLVLVDKVTEGFHFPLGTVIWLKNICHGLSQTSSIVSMSLAPDEKAVYHVLDIICDMNLCGLAIQS